MQVAAVFISVAVLCVSIHLSRCEVVTEQSAVEVGDKETQVIAEQSPKAVDDVSVDKIQGENVSRQHGSTKMKKKKPKLKLKKAKKILKKLLPFLLIPLIIQAKIIPLFLFKLKLMALKALGVGKLALLVIIFNIIYNAAHGAEDVDQQYSQDVLAAEHYGYNGGPEYGAWVN